ncbi:competence regulator inhibitor paratox [Streptococcus dysgalactiae]|uniref:competence regulator inhibitor paratox n=1 Tax=Streptococcus dysgalactiae TaxID=1334 RepID=UPI002DD42FCC|nr:Paratox [Streptococcus dysgalactiae]MEC4576810.1 Paratox [Streptococcus dysgalactiae]
MLTYDEFKQAIDDGYITGDTVIIVRKNGQIFDYVLSGEPVRPWETLTEERVEAVLKELQYIK